MARVLVAGERERADTFGRHVDVDHQVLLSYRAAEAVEIVPDVDCVVALEELASELAGADPAVPVVAVTGEAVDAAAALPPDVDAETLLDTIATVLHNRQHGPE